MVEYIAFGAICFAVAVAGGVAGLVLGNLRLPAATSIAETVAAGGGANVAISAVAAATAATKHIREGRINWTMFWWLVPPSLVGGLVGGYLATVVPETALLLFISLVLFYGAWELSQWLPPERRKQPVYDGSARGDHRVATVTIGLIVGILGGAVGLILGSLRFPALLRFTHESPQQLVGTNLSAGVVVGVAGAIGHLTAGDAGFDFTLFAVGAVCSAPGAYIGAHLTGRLSALALVRTIAAIVFIAACAMLLKVVL
ncbi:MAG: sulfite exporter TauE/SafE family protein [Thermoleophilaceae bacterium]|nr:sulfite exporter TauE/SafE family protein [Thermoleophilaceae bacterium]